MFKNLTAHNIVIHNGPTIPPSGSVARVASTPTAAGDHDGVSLSRIVFGEVVGLPEAEPGVILIVSALVRTAVPSRKDVASPGESVLGPDGRPVACKGLVVN